MKVINILIIGLLIFFISCNYNEVSTNIEQLQKEYGYNTTIYNIPESSFKYIVIDTTNTVYFIYMINGEQKNKIVIKSNN